MFLRTSKKPKNPFLFHVKKFLHISRANRSRKTSKCLIQVKNSDILCNEKSNEINESSKGNLKKGNNPQFIQHVFRWGIGNRFRADPETRYHPVHLERPKEVTIKKSYFLPVNENIIYEKLNEQWEVFWYENNKINAKPFPIKKYGIEAAKKEAIKFYESLKKNNKMNEKPTYESGVEGVYFDSVTNCWISFYREKNFPVCRSFSAEFHGFETAKQMAISRVLKHKR